MDSRGDLRWTGDRRYDTFLSYSMYDRDQAKKIAESLRSAGLRVWFDAWEIRAGMAIAETVTKGLLHSKVQLVLVGPRGPARGSDLDYERLRQEGLAPRIVPVILPGTRWLDVERLLLPHLRDTLAYTLPSDSDEDTAGFIAFLKSVLPTIRDPSCGQSLYPSVFLCHAKEDSRRVQGLYYALRDQMIDPWYDRLALRVGDAWEAAIMRAIEKSSFFAILMSSRSVNKTGFLNREIRKAVAQFQLRPCGATYLLPIRLETCVIPPLNLDNNTLLSDLHWLDVFDGDENAVRTLGDQIWEQWQKGKHVG